MDRPASLPLQNIQPDPHAVFKEKGKRLHRWHSQLNPASPSRQIQQRRHDADDLRRSRHRRGGAADCRTQGEQPECGKTGSACQGQPYRKEGSLEQLNRSCEGNEPRAIRGGLSGIEAIAVVGYYWPIAGLGAVVICGTYHRQRGWWNGVFLRSCRCIRAKAYIR